MKQTLTLPYKLPSLNEIIGADRRNRYLGGELKKQWTNTVSLECKKQKLKAFKNQINITITWHCKNKKRDKDNIMAGQKFIFDGLIKAGIIQNDGWKEIGEIQHKFTTDTTDKVTITMEEVRQWI